MGDHTTDATAVPIVANHDGSSGTILNRAEPKVRTASAVALVTPLVSFFVLKYVPGLSSLADAVDAIVATVLTGVLTFAAGYLTRPVRRIDLLLTSAEHAVWSEVSKTAGARVEAELEDWVHTVGMVAQPALASAESAVVGLVRHSSAAAAAGTDPIVAARVSAPETLAALQAAAKQAAEAEAEAARTAARQAAAAELQARLSAATGAGTNPNTTDLIEAIRRGLDALDGSATPIGDAARAAVPTAEIALPPVPPVIPAPAAPVEPATTEMPVIPPPAAPAS